MSCIIFNVSPFGHEYYYARSPVTFDEASKFCLGHDATVARPNNSVTQSFIHEHLAHNDTIWIGVIGVPKTSAYVGLTGDHLTYTNWRTTKRTPCSGNCTVYLDTDGLWTDSYNSSMVHGVVCERPLPKVIFSPSPFGKEYHFDKRPLTFDESKSLCESIGGRLIKIRYIVLQMATNYI